jgi:hypothetical protein
MFLVLFWFNINILVVFRRYGDVEVHVERNWQLSPKMMSRMTLAVYMKPSQIFTPDLSLN